MRWNPGFSNVTCPQCLRRIPLDTVGMLPSVCPVCDEPVVQRETAEERAERESGYARATASRFTFAPGTGPFSAPVSTTGRGGEERWLGGSSFEVRPGVIVPPRRVSGGTPRWVKPDRPVFDKDQERLHHVENIQRSNVSAWDEAAQFVIDNHYAHGLPNIQPNDTVFHGMYHDVAGLVGVAIYISQPMGHYEKGASGPSSILNVFPGGTQEALELSRFILRPEVPYGGETWFLDKSRDLLRKQGYRGFISFSDPHARVTAEGEILKPGHYGTIYKAAGLVYFGQIPDQTTRFLPDWSVFYGRGETKIRTGESGWDNQVRKLMEYGAKAPKCLKTGVPDIVELDAWLNRWLPRLTRKIRHPGKHKFAYLTDPKKERDLRRLGRLAGSERWSSEPVNVPIPAGVDVWPSGKKPSGIQRYGPEPPRVPATPEIGRLIKPNPVWR